MEEEEHSVNFKIPHQVGDEHDTAGSICLTIAALLSILLSAEDHQRSEQNQNAAKKKNEAKRQGAVAVKYARHHKDSAVFQLSSGTGAQCRQDEAARIAAYAEPIFFL